VDPLKAGACLSRKSVRESGHELPVCPLSMNEQNLTLRLVGNTHSAERKGPGIFPLGRLWIVSPIHAVETGRDDVYLRLTPEQYRG
jgi:hypothetical protein